MSNDKKVVPRKLERPHQLKTLTPDQTVAAILRLAMEVSVLRERLATQEILLEAAGGVSRDQIDRYTPDAEEGKRRAAERTALIEQIISDLS